MNEPRPAFHLDLANNRHWRLFLGVLFGLTFLCRFLIHGNLESHPVGRPEEWPGSESWLPLSLAQRAVEDGDWLLAGPNILLTREMAAWLPLRSWGRLADSRLPRCTAAVYLLAVSLTVTHSLALYTVVSLLASGALAVLAALAGAQLFGCRRAGALAGLAVALHGSLALAGVLVGPWQWEALALAALLWLLPSLRADQPAARWLLAGLLLALGLWLRSFFWWAVLAAAVVAWRQRPGARFIVALFLPLVISAMALVARNIVVHAPATPTVGMPAWDFLETTNPASVLKPNLPPDTTLLEASRGRFPQMMRLVLGESAYRGAILPNLERKLRELLGARDQTWSLNQDYLRRRTELLRVMTVPPDVTMALGWAAVILLVVLRRVPAPLAVAMALVLAHGLLFRTSGMERCLLHLVLAVAIGGAGAELGKGLRGGERWPLLFLVLWAGIQWLLAVDDQARGTRFRPNEFQQAAMAFRRSGNETAAQEEIEDYRSIARRDVVLTNFWNTQR